MSEENKVDVTLGLLDEEAVDYSKRKGDLNQLIDKGTSVKSLMSHPAFPLFKAWIDNQAQDSKGQLLSESITDDEAKKLRYQCQVYQKIANWFSEQIVKGEKAKGSLDAIYEEEKKLGFGID